MSDNRAENLKCVTCGSHNNEHGECRAAPPKKNGFVKVKPLWWCAWHVYDVDKTQKFIAEESGK